MVRRGFTLIELMVVVIIVAILAAAAVPIYQSFSSRAHETEILTALATIQRAQRVRKGAEGAYAADLSTLIDEGYLTYADFVDLKYVECSSAESCTLSTNSNGDAVWTGSIPAYNYASLTMAPGGDITRLGSAPEG